MDFTATAPPPFNNALSFTNGALKHQHPHHPHPEASYKECLKNHAASLGGHAVDGCGEFMLSPIATPSDPSSLRCAACGCHRNFHRPLTPPPSPPPSYYSPAPHMLMVLKSSGPSQQNGPNWKKRHRTKFSEKQKEKMYRFSERLGWKMQKSNEGLVEEFCNEVGVAKGVFKVWMHNNKHARGKKEKNNCLINGDNISHKTYLDDGR